jgi:hypothetical protein
VHDNVPVNRDYHYEPDLDSVSSSSTTPSTKPTKSASMSHQPSTDRLDTLLVATASAADHNSNSISDATTSISSSNSSISSSSEHSYSSDLEPNETSAMNTLKQTNLPVEVKIETPGHEVKLEPAAGQINVCEPIPDITKPIILSKNKLNDNTSTSELVKSFEQVGPFTLLHTIYDVIGSILPEVKDREKASPIITELINKGQGIKCIAYSHPCLLFEFGN